MSGAGPGERWLIALLGALNGAWLLFDGLRALVTGGYTTPASGEHAGQLGPWATLLRGLGVDPLSPAVMGLHIALGIAWLVIALWQLIAPGRARKALLATALAGLWYLPVGTAVSLVVLALSLSARATD